MRRRKRKIQFPVSSEVEAAPIPSSDEPDAAPIPSQGRTSGSDDAARLTPRTRAGNVAERWGRIPRSLVEGFRLEAMMGEGSMGAVFKAEQLSLHRPVAVKILAPRLAKNERFLRRFMREARAVAKLNHPNVVSGIDVGEAQGFRYFVMEFVEGPTLLDMLEGAGAMEPMAATRIVLQVARALEHAARHNLVHRDVKPANVIITKSGVAKLCDLGLAKEVDEAGGETSEGRAMGTPLYISPEQARGDPDVDIRSDLYSLGATYYHALVGRPPFDGPTHAVIMAKHLTEDLVPVQDVRPDVPPGCASICEKLLEKDRDDRHESPTELIEELQAVIEGRWEEKPKIRSRRRSRRRRFR